MRKLYVGMLIGWLVGCLIGGGWLMLSSPGRVHAEEPDVDAAASLQTDKLVADQPASNEYFGTSVAMGQDFLVVGTPRVTRSLASPIALPGTAQIFKRDAANPNQWNLVKTISAGDGQPDDGFGFSVALSGDTVVIGAPGHDSDNSANAGAAYVFRRNQGGSDNWGQVAKIISTDIFTDDEFGISVSLDSSTLVVGAHLDNVSVSGVFRSNQGAAYVFRRDVGGADGWGPIKKISGSDCITGDQFGISVALNGGRLVVGARLHDPDGLNNAGAAYLFGRDFGGADQWGEVKKLTASDKAGGDQFGQSVAVDGDVVVVGANGADIGGRSNQGAAYVFSRNQGGADAWGQVRKIVAQDGQDGDQFGNAVSLRGDTLMVGAPVADVGGRNQRGAAYAFARIQGGTNNWGQSEKLIARDGDTGDLLGIAVATNGGQFLAGAPRANLFDQFDTGAAYVFVGNAQQIHLPMIQR
jgi:hypothetical protein